MIAGESLAAVEPSQTFKPDQFKVDGAELVSRPVVEPVEATARFETRTPLQVVIALHVPRVRCFRSASSCLPDVCHAGRHAAELLQLSTEATDSHLGN